ncbi:MAG TPA: hypothetical protein VF188_18905 [Longimicrobiales bacterium]
MSGRLAVLVLGACISAFTGCDDAVTVPAVQARDLNIVVPDLTRSSADAPAIASGRTNVVAPTSVPPEFERPPTILWTSLDAGFDGATAWGTASMRFFGTNGEETLSLRAKHEGTTVASSSRKGERAELIPWEYRIDTSGAVPVPDDCGHVLTAEADFKAWHQYAGLVWGLTTSGDTDIDYQPGCEDPTDDPGGEDGGDAGGDDDGDSGGSDGGSDTEEWMICSWTEYYDAETGEYLYSEFHGCVPL